MYQSVSDTCIVRARTQEARLAELIAVLHTHGVDLAARYPQGGALVDVLQALGHGAVIAALSAIR